MSTTPEFSTPEAVEPSGPRVKIGAASDRERHMVQARPPLIEGLTGVAVVVVQPERDARTRLHQDDGVAALLPAMMRERNRHPRHAEHPLIPLRTGLHVGDGRREVVIAGDRGRHPGLSHGSLPRRRQALNPACILI